MKQFSQYRLTALLGALALLCAGPAPGQQAGGNLTEAWHMTIKRGEEQAFEAAFKAHAAVRAAQGDGRNWDVFVPVTGEHLNRYEIRTCCFAWADQDAYEQWYEDNPQVMGQWFAEVAPHVESYAHYFYETDGANSHWPADGGPVRFVGVTEFRIAPGSGPGFAAAREELSQIAINQGWTAGGKRWAWLDRIGGEPTALLAVAFGNYADMASDGPSFAEFLAEKMGTEGARALLERLSAATAGTSYSIWAHRPDLTDVP